MNTYIFIDPSIWWNEQIMMDKVNSIRPIYLLKRLYIATANQGDTSYEIKKETTHFMLY
ncbi:MAG: putative alpha/beta superfamily hydrolase [Maribacter sp.]|jgi:predicted alpha/beta superfamily hydrolase